MTRCSVRISISIPPARRKAIKRIAESRLVFTTCVGAALGLLRNQNFETVVIDEASQQTEPASLIPLVKGCQRAILVGDHVQLRATVSPHAAALDFDISLMERLWTAGLENPVIGRVMLDTQYRLHPTLCEFPSSEFYAGRLVSATACSRIQLPNSCFPWPQQNSKGKTLSRTSSRAVFIQCPEPEDYGNKSKVNQAQAKICKEVLSLLTTVPPATKQSSGGKPAIDTSTSSPSIAILTPYSRQAELLKKFVRQHQRVQHRRVSRPRGGHCGLCDGPMQFEGRDWVPQGHAKAECCADEG